MIPLALPLLQLFQCSESNDQFIMSDTMTSKPGSIYKDTKKAVNENAEKVSKCCHDAKEKCGQTCQSAKGNVQGAMERSKETMNKMGETVNEKASQLADGARGLADSKPVSCRLMFLSVVGQFDLPLCLFYLNQMYLSQAQDAKHAVGRAGEKVAEMTK
ncbi:hypothetical protein PENTCL1PPCAC_18606 [Pristionchus entomophagus]|uniref:Uncharacterized protein n=1 Tax=Pristionchus entomophagus TaxID=358040 RepID=A0AAV5TQ20_9BILA|nr:hypothetical protein PENTCL1PPCAC_18606 [Pristionchus entomophagus]